MTVSVSVRQWGNSLGIRIPAKALKKMDLCVDDNLIMEVFDDHMIITKSFKHKTFEQRLAEYGGAISVTDFDWGEPKGKEML